MEPTRDLAGINDGLQQTNREVWVVTASVGERRGGLLATFVMRSSIDPNEPQVMIGLAPNHHTCELVSGSGRFGLHLLALDQVETAWRFAIGSSRDVDRFAGLATLEVADAPPLLADCLARFDCQVFSRWSTGDRTYFWADIRQGSVVRSATALRERDLFAAANEDQRSALITGMQADLAVQAPLRAAWRNRQPGLP